MPFSTTRRIEFCQTDAAGIVHFSAFFPMMESAEHELLRSLGFSVMPPPGHSPRLTWPRVAAACDYHNAARFEDEITIDVWVEKIGTSSVSYRFKFHRGDKPIASGSLTAVCCDLASGSLQKVAIPDSFRQALQSVA